MEQKKFSVTEAFKFAVSTFLDNFFFFFKVNVFFLVIIFMGSLLAGLLFFISGSQLLSTLQDIPRIFNANPDMVKSIAKSLLLSIGLEPVLAWITSSIILVFCVGIFFNFGEKKIALEFYDFNKSKIRTLFSRISVFIKGCVIVLSYLLFIILGSILCVIPGIYFFLRYYFALFVLIDKNTGIIQSFNISSELTKGVKLQLFGFSILCFMIYMVLPHSIAWLFIIGPVLLLAQAHIYRQLLAQTDLSVLQ